MKNLTGTINTPKEKTDTTQWLYPKKYVLNGVAKVPFSIYVPYSTENLKNQRAFFPYLLLKSILT